MDGAIKFVKITPEELTVKTATAAGETSTADGKPDITEPGRYKSYVQLATDEDGKDVYKRQVCSLSFSTSRKRSLRL